MQEKRKRWGQDCWLLFLWLHLAHQTHSSQCIFLSRVEICFYNFAKTFIYGSGQLAAGRAMCQWSWRMLNVWYGSVQTASTWFANILVLCIYKAASERRGFLSKVLQHGRQFIYWGNSSIYKLAMANPPLSWHVLSPWTAVTCLTLQNTATYSFTASISMETQHHQGSYNETRRGKPLQPPPSPAGHVASRGTVPADVPMRIPCDIQLPALGHGWRSVCPTKQTPMHRRSLNWSPQLQESQREVIREDRSMAEVNVLHPPELTIPKTR